MATLPPPIFMVSKSGEVITMEAISNNQYEKCYFLEYEVGKPLVNPRKVKVIKTDDVRKYFKECVEEKGYSYIPQ